MIDVALHFTIYISKILHIAFSSTADPSFGQLAYHSKRYCCKKLPSLPVCLLLPIGIRQNFCPKPQVNLNSRHTHLAKKSNDAQLHKSFTHCYSDELNPTYLLFCFGKAPQIVVRCLKPPRAFLVPHPVSSNILFLKLPQQKNQSLTSRNSNRNRNTESCFRNDGICVSLNPFA